MTRSRSDVRSTVVRFFVRVGSPRLLRPSVFSFCFSCSTTSSRASKRASQSCRYCSIHAVSPPAGAGPACRSARDRLLGGHEAGLLQDAHVLLHARERHVEPVGELGDRSVGPAEPLENAAPSGVRERGERGIEASAKSEPSVHYVRPTAARRKGGCVDVASRERGRSTGDAEEGIR